MLAIFPKKVNNEDKKTVRAHSKSEHYLEFCQQVPTKNEYFDLTECQISEEQLHQVRWRH